MGRVVVIVMIIIVKPNIVASKPVKTLDQKVQLCIAFKIDVLSICITSLSTISFFKYEGK